MEAVIQQEYRQEGRESLFVRLSDQGAFESVLLRPPCVGIGDLQIVRIRGGVLLTTARLATGALDTVSVNSHCGFVAFSFNLSSRPLPASLNGKACVSLPGYSFASAPENIAEAVYCSRSALRWLNLYLRPADLLSYMDESQQHVPSGLVDGLAGCGVGLRFHTCPFTAEMRDIIERIDGCPFRGSLKRMYLEGKILELLALRLGQMAEAQVSPRIPARTQRVLQRLNDARAILRDRLRNPPSLHALSGEVAMSASLLKAAFREQFGVTVFGYLRNLRLDRAREMILHEGSTAKEAAWSVGYASPSHFVRAFRRRFGESPGACARLPSTD